MNPATFAAEYIRRGHAIQTAVAHDINMKGAKGAAADSKHLRVGTNVNMCDIASIAKLLIDKGVITEHEFQEAILAGLDREIERYKELYPGINFI